MHRSRGSPRVAVFIHDLSGGAFTNIGTSLARGFQAQGLSVDLVIPGSASPSELATYSDISVRTLNARSGSLSLPALIRYLRRESPDVLLSMPHHMNFPAIVATRLARTGTKVVVSEQNNLSYDAKYAFNHNWKMRAIPSLITTLYPFADGIVAPSRDVLTDPLFSRCTRYCRAPQAVIPNPLPRSIGSQANHSSPEPAHPWLVAERRVPVFVSVGRLVEQKGFDTLINAMNILKQRGAQARLLILGEGPLRKELETLRNTLELCHEVELLGFRYDVRQFLSWSDGVIAASRWEGFGVALMEAMACGKPIVATNAPGGPREYLRDNQNALVVQVDDPQALAAAMEQLVSRPRYAAKLGASARRTASQYDAAVVASSYVRFFQSLLPLHP